jgi:uncharacterized membrane protein YdjX (TVP38/TMEM64 family)
MAPPLNWAIGVTRVRLRDYVLGSALGVVPCIAITSYAADTVAQAGSLSALLTPDTLLPASLAFIVVTAGALAAWKFLRRGEQSSGFSSGFDQFFWTALMSPPFLSLLI